MPQYWSEDSPCAYCPGVSNVTHQVTCQNYGIYDSKGSLIPYEPPKQQSIQLTLDIEVTPHQRRRRL